MLRPKLVLPIVASLLVSAAIIMLGSLGRPSISFGTPSVSTQAHQALHIAPSAVIPEGRTTLARPIAEPKNIKAFASAAYVHQANCRAALVGSNGDDDINGFTGYGKVIAFNWNPAATRYGPTRFIQYYDVYTGPEPKYPYNHWNVGIPGYCMGDDSSIIDRVVSAPAGW